ncbi:MAG: hypothetical protein WD314_08390 [Trueperaceae bacterium]
MFTSLPVTAALTAPAEVPAGGRFEDDWQGPDNQGDYVTIVPAGSPEGSYESYFDTRNGSPGTLVAPAESGAFEVRYVSGQSAKTLSSSPIRVR